MKTAQLPQLRGTPAQIKWATAIRHNAVLADPWHNADGPCDAAGLHDKLSSVLTVDDASWWIANRTPDSNLRTDFKEPQAHQRVGGPPPPDLAKGRNAMRKAIGMGEFNEPEAEDEPHEAELFAEAVSMTPPLASIAILAALSRLYKGKERGVLRHRVECQLETVRADMVKAIDRDIAGIRKILGKQ